MLWLEKQAHVRGPGSGVAGVLLAANEFPRRCDVGMCACADQYFAWLKPIL